MCVGLVLCDARECDVCSEVECLVGCRAFVCVL